MESTTNQTTPSQSLLTVTDKENLTVLAQRKKGELLKVQDGKLMPMSFGESLIYRIFGAKQKELAGVLKTTIDTLTAKITVNDAKDIDLNDLFISKMGSLSTKIYSRTIHESVYHHFENSLDKSLTSTQKAAAIWGQLGNTKPPDVGASGSYIIKEGKIKNNEGKTVNKSSKGKFIGIFKPSNEDTLSPGNPQWKNTAKRIAYNTILRPFTGSIRNMTQGQSMYAEKAAEITQRYLNEAIIDVLSTLPKDNPHRDLLKNISLELVPSTEMLTINLAGKGNVTGSFQEWIHAKEGEEVVRADDFLGTDAHYKAKGSQPPDVEKNNERLSLLFDVFIIYGIIHGDTDRHAENLFFILDNEKNIVGMRLIDNGRAMSDTHPGFWGMVQANKQTVWENHPIAAKPITEIGREIMQAVWPLKPFIQAAQDSLYSNVGDEYAIERSKRTGERMTILRQPAKTKKDMARQIKNVHKTHKAVLISGTTATSQPS